MFAKSKCVIIVKTFLRVCHVCRFILTGVDRMPEQVLRGVPVRALHEYIEAYGIAKDMPFVEKTDLIKTIVNAELTENSEEVLHHCDCVLTLDIPSRHARV